VRTLRDGRLMRFLLAATEISRVRGGLRRAACVPHHLSGAANASVRPRRRLTDDHERFRREVQRAGRRPRHGVRTRHARRGRRSLVSPRNDDPNRSFAIRRRGSPYQVRRGRATYRRVTKSAACHQARRCDFSPRALRVSVARESCFVEGGRAVPHYGRADDLASYLTTCQFVSVVSGWTGRGTGGRGAWLKSKSLARLPRIGTFSRTVGRRSGRPSVFGSRRWLLRKSSSMNLR